MFVNENAFDSFFKTIEIKKHFSVVEKIGLQDTTINASKVPNNCDLDFSVKELYIYNKEGILISSTKFRKFGDQFNTANNIGPSCQNFSKLNKLVKDLNKNKNKEKARNAATSNINSNREVKTPRSSQQVIIHTDINEFLNHDSSHDNFIFDKIYLNNQKVFFLSKSSLVLVGIFDQNVNSYVIKLYLMHMFTAFLNFIGDTVDLLFNPKKEDTSQNLDRSFNYITKDFFQVKIFELYFVIPLTHHFEKVIKLLMRKEEMYLSYIKFKNFYLLDITTGEILCDMMSIRGKQAKNIKENEKLWQELLHHSQNLLNQYKADNENKYDSTHFFYNFVKVECTSTYPRLTFVIKFLPILNGVSLIHVYSQNKLSRYNDSETSISQSKTYKEIDIIYGSEIKSSSNIEFRYTEPKKLKEIEKFFIEFYLSTVNKCNLFYNSTFELKYFDNFLINCIDDIINHNKNSNFESIITKINSKFYDYYLNGVEGRNVNLKDDKVSSNIGNLNTNGLQVDNSESNVDTSIKRGNIFFKLDGDYVNTNFMNINKQFILKELFLNNNINLQGNLNTANANKINAGYSDMKSTSFMKDNTLMLSRIDDNQNQTKQNLNDYEVSLDLTKQLSEISRMELNEEENFGLIHSYIKGSNYNPNNNYNPTINNSATLENILMTYMDKKETSSPIATSSNKLRTKNEKSVTKSLNKLQQSISNIELKMRTGSKINTSPSKNVLKSYNRSNTPTPMIPQKNGNLQSQRTRKFNDCDNEIYRTGIVNHPKRRSTDCIKPLQDLIDENLNISIINKKVVFNEKINDFNNLNNQKNINLKDVGKLSNCELNNIYKVNDIPHQVIKNTDTDEYAGLIKVEIEQPNLININKSPNGNFNEYDNATFR